MSSTNAAKLLHFQGTPVAGLSTQERDAAIQMAVGRLLLIGSRPFQEGDLEEFDRIRSVVMTLAQR